MRALGHEVRLMPAQYVKAYIKRHAICSLRSRFIVSHRAETNFAFSAKKQKGRPAPCGAAPSSIRAGGHRYPPHRGPDQRNPPSKTDLVFCFCSRRRAGHFCSRLGSKSFRRSARPFSFPEGAGLGGPCRPRRPWCFTRIRARVCVFVIGWWLVSIYTL